MAGRELPGQADADTRWLVDRQVYERRRHGVRYVSWSRTTQVRLVWLVSLLLFLAVGLGAASVWAWQRYAPELVAAMPAPLRSQLAAWDLDGGAMPDAARLRELEAALDLALRERDAVLAELAAASAAATPAPPAPAAAPAVAVESGEPGLETTLLRHERDAAREQIDALMQLTTQLKAELAGAGRNVAANGAGQGIDAGKTSPAASARVAELEAELSDVRAASAEAMATTLAERDRALASLNEADAAARALQAAHDRLAIRVAAAEQALASRDQLVADGRKALEAAETALSEARRTALEEKVAAQAAVRELQGELESRDEAVRTAEASVASLEAARQSMLADLQRVGAERDALAVSLQALDERQPAGGTGVSSAERDQLAARIVELQGAADAARAAAAGTAQELAKAQGELAGAVRESGELREALDVARANLQHRDQLLAAVPALQARLAAAEGQAREQDKPALSPGAATVLPAATWTVVEDVPGIDAALRDELATALARLKDLDGRVAGSERRAAELERYLAEQAPLPPPAAPR